MKNETTNVEKYKFEPIKGYPMLNWKGKRPFTATQFYPAQLKEIYGQPDDTGWMNKIFWGDNLQVMSHLLKIYRGKIKLIYLDPPFDSKATYGSHVKLKGKDIEGDISSFEEKQYSDIWNNDDYLQFLYERLVLIRELLSDDGGIFVHLDYRRSHHARLILDEIFGASNFRNEIIWHYGQRTMPSERAHPRKHDNILFYAKTEDLKINSVRVSWTEEEVIKMQKQEVHTDEQGDIYFLADGGRGKPRYRRYIKDIVKEGKLLDDVWEIPILTSSARERTSYPTQKPEELIEKIIHTASNPGDIVFDPFMGSGTTQSVALKMKRRFLGSDINMAAVQISAKRLVKLSHDHKLADFGLEMYNVNNYDVFKNPLEARELLLKALEVSVIVGSIYDGEKDGRMVKVMPINRITTRADLSELINGFDYKLFNIRKETNPNQMAEKILLVCMGHEVDLKAYLELEVKVAGFNIDVEVVDILRDKTGLQFKRDSEAKVLIKDNKLIIEKFYPMNLLQKLSLQKNKVEEWRELVESVLIDWNYDGAVISPTIIDIPEKNNFVSGKYEVPKDAGTIRIKITDLLSETIEIEVSK